MTQVNENAILNIINFVLPGNCITKENIDENLIDLGMDSITFIQVIVALEEEFECEIPDEKLLITEMDTVKKIMDVLQTLYEEQKIE